MNFKQYNMPKEIYSLWKKYYYLTAIQSIPTDLLQEVKQILTLEFNSLDYILLFHIQDILMNRDLIYDNFYNKRFTYDEIEAKCKAWLQSYIKDNPSIKTTSQMLKNFPWHYKSLN